MNEHLLGVPDGDQNAVIQIPMKGYVPSAPGSGHVPRGRYELTIRKVGFFKKKEKEGKNLRLEMRISGPAKFSGVPIRDDKPTPIGTPGTKEYDDGLSFMQQVVASYASGIGKLKELQASDAPYPLAPAKLLEKKVYVMLDDDAYNDRLTSKVVRYITVEEFNELPGPEAASGATATTGVQTSAQVQSPAQRTAPEVISQPANGAAADALGF